MLFVIGMRQATGVLGNAAVVGETRDCFYVRERRPAQGQPFGLEDARTGLAQGRGRRDILQHGRLHRRKEKGRPVSRLPIWSLGEPRRFVRIRRTHMVSTVYSAATSVIGSTEMNVRPLALA